MADGAESTAQLVRATSTDPTETAEALLIRAEALERLVLDQPGRGRVAAEALAQRARAAGCAEAEAVACRLAGWAARELFDHAAARRLLSRARTVARAHGLSTRLGQVWVTWSAVHMELGDLRAAARDVAAARVAFAPAEPLELVFAEGLVAQKAGRVDEAVTAYQRAIATAGPDDQAVRFKAANNLGEVLLEAGRLDEADASLALASELGAELSLMFAAVAASNRGTVAVHRGHLASADAHYAAAEDLARRAGLALIEFRLEQVNALRAVGLWPEAEARLDSLVREFDLPGAALLRADANLLLAEAALRNGDPTRSLRAALEARKAFTHQRRSADSASAVVVAAEARLTLARSPTPAADPPGDPLGPEGRATLRRAARTLANRGELDRAVAAWLLVGKVASLRRRNADAVRAWSQAAELAAGGPVLVRARGHLARALAADTPVACRRACSAGLADIDAHREGVASSELRARLAIHGHALAAVALATLPPQCPSRLLFRWLEAGRSIGQVATAPQPDDAGLADDLAALRRIAAGADGGRDRDPVEERAQLLQQRRLETRVRRRAWSDATAARASGPVGLPRLLDRLGDGQLVSYGLIDERLVAVTVGRGRVGRHDLGPVAPIARTTRSLAFALRRLTGSGAGAGTAIAPTRRALTTLDAQLAVPVAGGAGEVVMVPPPELAAVPWGALPTWAGRPVRVVPSARTWLDTAGDAPAPTGPETATLLVAGPGLPGADEEVRRLTALRPDARTLVGPAATSTATTEALAEAAMAHIACHGTMRPDAPLFSALHLVDGPVTVYEIERVPRLPAVVVLAACDAGLTVPTAEAGEAGRSGSGDALGFPSVLLQRGTRAVIAATVPVPDVASASLMHRFHTELLAGATTAAALATVRAEADPSTPAELATAVAFTCFGGG